MEIPRSENPSLQTEWSTATFNGNDNEGLHKLFKNINSIRIGVYSKENKGSDAPQGIRVNTDSLDDRHGDLWAAAIPLRSDIGTKISGARMHIDM